MANHAIAQEALVTGAVFRSEIGGIIELHIHHAELHDGARNFGTEAEGNTFIGLNVNDQAIGFQIADRGVAEKDERRAAKLNPAFGVALRKALAGAQVKRNTGPTPIVNLQFQSDKRFGVRITSDVRFTAISDHSLGTDGAWAVLATNHTGEDFFRTKRLNGVENFRLLVADFVGVEGNWRLHSGHGEQLKKMIGDHVTKGPGGFVKATTMFDADGFCGGDLHVVDVIAIPEGLDDVVGKAKDHDVLDGFFAEVMIDA